MNTPPDQKPLRSASFVVHVTRGVIRDQNMRRKAMLALLVVALLLLLSGSTFLAPLLNPREHLGWSLFFWLSCVWLTLTALLLALFDLLIVRVQARKARRALNQEFSPGLSPNSPSGREGE
jgi:protein-S-isoprenylcysteine O-methyltransferase Ste14